MPGFTKEEIESAASAALDYVMEHGEPVDQVGYLFARVDELEMGIKRCIHALETVDGNDGVYMDGGIFSLNMWEYLTELLVDNTDQQELELNCTENDYVI